MTIGRMKKYGDWMDHKVLDEPKPGQLVIKPHPGVVIFGIVLSIFVLLLLLWILTGVSYLFFGELSFLILLISLGCGVMCWRRFRDLNTRIILDKTANRFSISGAAPLWLSDIKRLYVVRWERQSSHRIRLNELNLETADGRRENILITPFESAFKIQAEKLSEWLDVPISWP